MLPIHRLATVDSTNRIAKELAIDGAVHGTSVIAENQTAGRGRLGKVWQSTPGKGLYCSIIVRPAIQPIDYPKITLAAGVAVARVLDFKLGCNTQLKWPNDIYINGRKCAGILSEAAGLSDGPKEIFAVVGIGINIYHKPADFSPELRDQVTSLFQEAEVTLSIEELHGVIRDKLLQQLVEFEQNGFIPIYNLWKAKDYLKGKVMECVSKEGKVVKGTAMGIDKNGNLFVQESGGTLHEVLSGDVSLAGQPK